MLERMLFVGLNTNDLSIIKKLIKEYHVGGVILYSKNYRNFEEMIHLINQIHSWAEEEGYVILVGIDEEGYRVNRLPQEIKNLKSPYAFRNHLDDLLEHAKIIADILSKSNININFAPVLDIKRFPDNHAIGDRCFGDNKELVIKNTLPYIKEFQKRNVIPVVKHFPGHGAIKANSHYFVPIIWHTKRLLAEDVLPFREAIKQGVDVVMVGHFIIPKFFLFKPTSISRKTVQFLRKNFHFSSVIMTDDLAMGPLKLANKAKIMQKAINSGMNMIMIKYYDHLFLDIDKLRKSKNLNQANIAYSIQLIEQMIIKYHINNDEVTHLLNINEINERIKQLNEHIK